MKTKIISLGTIILASIILTGCGVPLVQYDNKVKTLSLKVAEEKTYDVNFDKPSFADYGTNQCVQKNYRISEAKHPKYGYLYVKHTSLKSRCAWNGLVSGYFEDFAKRVFKATNVKKLDTVKNGNYEFTKYNADVKGKNMNITIVEVWGGNGNTFIIDVKGILTEEIKQALNENS